MWSLYILAEMHKSGQPEYEGELNAVEGCLRDRDLVRREAAGCLGAVGGRRAIAILKSMLDDPCDEVKSSVKNWLQDYPS
jgi:HEAT repeat protein